MKDGSVKVSNLVQLFQVSEETIRRDLTHLEGEGVVKKNYGGAVLAEEMKDFIKHPPINQRQLLNFHEKDTVGKKAAELVQDNGVVILDAGTTTLRVAKYLKEKHNLRIITNGINVAEECCQNESASIFLVGGKVIKKSMSLIGPQAQKELENYSANIVFLGTTGVSLTKGFTSSDLYEADIKRVMVSAGDKVVIVADHTKFQKQGLVSFADFNEVDYLITSDKTDSSIVKKIESLGVKVIVSPT